MTLETYYVGVRVNALEDALETPVDERVGTIEVQTVILDKSGIRFQDQDGAKLVLQNIKNLFERLKVIFGDSAYKRSGLPDWVKAELGCILQGLR